MQKETIIALGAICSGIFVNKFLSQNGRYNLIHCTSSSAQTTYDTVSGISQILLIGGGLTYLTANLFHSQHPLRTTSIVLGSTVTFMYFLQKSKLLDGLRMGI